VNRYRITAAHAKLSALLAVMLLPCCVKQSDYEKLQGENQQLQARIDQFNQQLQQKQTDLAAAQAELLRFQGTQAQLLKTQEMLQQSQDELKALRAEFEKFRTQRRSAMVGKKYPVLNLDDGKVLRDAEIASISASDIGIRHEEGFIKVALANSSEDLRWEACYDPQEAKKQAREKMLAEARVLDARRARDQASPVPGTVESAPNAVIVLRAQLAEQRRQLNAGYQALAAKNPGVLRGDIWDSAKPEASPLLNTVSGSRAVLGISRLQSLRDTILATLQQLRELDPAAR
jgi:outer membrane murein-binding lipoprotein Lpp